MKQREATAALKDLEELHKRWDTYARIMGDRPQTSTGPVDSPVGPAAFLLDHDVKGLDLISLVFAGQAEGLIRVDVLDNITHFWLTKTAVSPSRLYRETSSS